MSPSIARSVLTAFLLNGKQARGKKVCATAVVDGARSNSRRCRCNNLSLLLLLLPLLLPLVLRLLVLPLSRSLSLSVLARRTQQLVSVDVSSASQSLWPSCALSRWPTFFEMSDRNLTRCSHPKA